MSISAGLKESNLIKRKREVEVAEIGPKGRNPVNQKMKLDSLFEYVQDLIKAYGEFPSNIQSAVKPLAIEDFCHFLFESTFEEPMLLVRRHAVIIKFNPIYAIILADKMFLVFANRTKIVNMLIQEVMYGVVDYYEETKQQSIKKKLNNFTEHRFYSAIFTTMVALFDQQTTSLYSRVMASATNTYTLKLTLKNDDSQNKIKLLKHDISSLKKSITAYQHALVTFITNEDHLCCLNLTPLKGNASLYARPLTEDITKYIDDGLNSMESCLSGFDLCFGNIKKIETIFKRNNEMTNSRLRSQEYNYIARRLTLRSMTIMFTVSTVWYSVYAMNLHNGIDQYSYRFYIIFVCSTTAVMVFCLSLIFNYFSTYYFDIKVDKMEA